MRPVLLFLDITNTGIQLLLLTVGLGIVFQSRVRRFLRTWQQFRQWQTTHGLTGASVVTPSAPPAPGMQTGRAESGHVLLQAPVAVDFSTIPLATVPNAARALAEPPASLW